MKTLKLSIPGLTIACKTWGNPSNPPILALHGWLDNANSFDLLAHLLQDKYYFIAIDLPGHGHSSHLPLGSHYHFIDAVFAVIQVVDALQYDKVHLLGHSMGACLASLAAGVAPHRFLSVSLIEGLGPFSSPASSACKQLSEYMHYLYQKDLKPSKGYSKREGAAKARALKGYISYELATILIERGVTEKEGAFYWRHDRRLLVHSPLHLTEEQILSCLKDIKAQTLLILASEGYGFDKKLMEGRINAVSHLQLERIQGGHHIHMEYPEAIASLLDAFL